MRLAIANYVHSLPPKSKVRALLQSIFNIPGKFKDVFRDSKVVSESIHIMFIKNGSLGPSSFHDIDIFQGMFISEGDVNPENRLPMRGQHIDGFMSVTTNVSTGCKELFPQMMLFNCLIDYAAEQSGELFTLKHSVYGPYIRQTCNKEEDLHKAWDSFKCDSLPLIVNRPRRQINKDDVNKVIAIIKGRFKKWEDTLHGKHPCIKCLLFSVHPDKEYHTNNTKEVVPSELKGLFDASCKLIIRDLCEIKTNYNDNIGNFIDAKVTAAASGSSYDGGKQIQYKKTTEFKLIGKKKRYVYVLKGSRAKWVKDKGNFVLLRDIRK